MRRDADVPAADHGIPHWLCRGQVQGRQLPGSGRMTPFNGLEKYLQTLKLFLKIFFKLYNFCINHMPLEYLWTFLLNEFTQLVQLATSYSFDKPLFKISIWHCTFSGWNEIQPLELIPRWRATSTRTAIPIRPTTSGTGTSTLCCSSVSDNIFQSDCLQ